MHSKPVPHALDPDKTFYAIDPRDFDTLNAKHDFSVDACSDQWNARLSRYWTVEDDCLSQSWAGESVWLHPPYEDEHLVSGILDRMLNSEADSALALLPGWAITPEYWRKLSAVSSITVTLAQRLRPFVAPGFPSYVPEYPLFLVHSF
jgi:hypothetical protein